MGPEEVHSEVLRPPQAEAMARVLAATFSAGDPLAVAVGLSVSEMTAFLLPLATHAASQGLTVVARCRATGELVGALLTDDLAVPAPVDLGRISRKFLPILDLLEGLDEQYRATRPTVPGQCLHLYMLGVDARFAGRGIAQALVQSCLANGREKGYQWAITEATGTASQHVFRKLGFRERFCVPYRDYRYRGDDVFASIQDHESAILMEKTLV